MERAERIDVPLRVMVLNPLPNVTLRMQRGATGKGELVAPVSSTGEAIAFEFDTYAEGMLPDGRPRLLGPFVQGPPDGRFVYLCVGQGAGQVDSPFNGRVKVPLGGLTEALIRGLKVGQRLEARIASRGRNGGPAYASVPLLAPGWQVAAR